MQADKKKALFFFLGFLFLGALFLVIFRSAAVLLLGDPSIYIFDGLLVHRGLAPYRDFFLAHPPLRVWIASLLFKLGGTPDSFSWVSLISYILATGAVGWVVLRLKGLWWALLTVFLYLFSTVGIRFCTAYVGTNMAQLFLAIALLTLFEDLAITSGILSAVAILQGLYAIPAVVGLLLLARAGSRLRRYLLGLAVVIPLFAGAWAFYGMPFIRQVFLYHLQKVAVVSGYHWATLLRFVFGDILLIIAPIGVLLPAVKERRLTMPFYFTVAALGTLAIIVLYKDLNDYYFGIVLPLLVPAAVLGAAELAKWLPDATWLRVTGLVISAVILVITYLPHLFYTMDIVRTHTMALEERQALLKVARRAIGPDAYVAGDSAIAPFLALNLGLNIPDNLVDTNNKRLKTNQDLKTRLIHMLNTNHLFTLVVVPDHGIMLDRDIRALVMQKFVPLFRFVGKAMHYDIYFYKKKKMSGLSR